jgi:uncharacterized iron-regulated membrane protein
MPLRKVIFWLHLAAGLIAGLVIGVMSFTGAVLAFEHEIVEWAERDLRRVEVSAATPLALDQLLAKVREVAPEDAKPAGVTVSRDPADAVAVSYGRSGTYYVNPYTGAVVPPTTTRTHDFMHLMVDWHRYLALSGDQRPVGKAITGVSNLTFLFLGLSGLWLWWPRAWNARVLRPSLWFVRGAAGKARDWNWHNVVGFWSLPLLVVLTATGAVISYRWASDLVYRAAGEQPPAQGAVGQPSENYTIARPENVSRLTYEGTLAHIQAAIPSWTSIALREGLPRRRGAPATPSTPERPRGPQPYSATVQADDESPSFATTALVIHPYTGELLDRTGYADQSSGRKARSWLRFLHTGQALGWPGQLIAGVACIGGLLLVYTGIALSWRRFFGKRRTDIPVTILD